jgi:hypothetical protein
MIYFSGCNVVVSRPEALTSKILVEENYHKEIPCPSIRTLKYNREKK